MLRHHRFWSNLNLSGPCQDWNRFWTPVVIPGLLSESWRLFHLTEHPVGLHQFPVKLHCTTRHHVEETFLKREHNWQLILVDPIHTEILYTETRTTCSSKHTLHSIAHTQDLIAERTVTALQSKQDTRMTLLSAISENFSLLVKIYQTFPRCLHCIAHQSSWRLSQGKEG